MPKLATGPVWVLRCCVLTWCSTLLLLSTAAEGGVVTHDAEIAGWCDGDNEVNDADVRTLLANWGACEPPADPDDPNDPNAHCLGDLNFNGHVGEADLAILMGHWGPCHVRGDLDDDGSIDQDDYDTIDAVIRDGDVDCGADLDLSGMVDDQDIGLAERVWTLNGYTNDVHYAAAEVDGTSTLSILDMILVYDNQGLDCTADVNRDRLINEDDLECLCVYADEDGAPDPPTECR